MDLGKITIDKIESALTNRTPDIWGIKRRNSIMATLIEKNGELNFIYTKRALTLAHQPGDICFPGGKQENDETPLLGAIRETVEELGIEKEHIRVIGELDRIVTMYGALIAPFLCIIEGIDVSDFAPNPYEVCKIITVPLRFFDESEPIRTETSFKEIFPEDFPTDLIYNGENYDWGTVTVKRDFYVYEGETIWGLTGRITRQVCDIIRNI